jgi:hypothetical protein
MAKHDETQHPAQSATQATAALSRYEEGVLARALADLADAIRHQSQGGRPISGEAALAADEYRDITSVLRAFLERAPDPGRPPEYSNSTGLKKR